MAVFLIDYENIPRDKGLQGLSLLNEKDTIELFYSDCCSTIRTDQMELIKKSGCRFRAYGLKQKGKNALDFYVATRCGILYAESEDSNIVIVSEDKGLNAILHFLSSCRSANGGNKFVHLASSIENGILALAGREDGERRSAARVNKTMVNIVDEAAKYQAMEAYRARISKALEGTAFEQEADAIWDFVEGQKDNGKKVVYSSAMHGFGRDRGRVLYRLIRDVI